MNPYSVEDIETVATDIPGAEGIAIDRQNDLFVCDWDAHGA
jgi:uncharacterized protein YjiK